MTAKSGEIIGLEPDMAKIMAEAMEVKLSIKPIPFNNLLGALLKGRVDVVMSQVSITGKRNMRVAFAGPYFKSGKAVLTRIEALAAARHVSEIRGPEIRVAALKGSTSQAFVERMLPGTKFLPVDSYGEAIHMVLSKGAEAMVADYPACAMGIFLNPGKGLLTSKEPLTYEPIGIAIPGNDPLFLNWVQNFLTTLKDSGILDDLKSKWFKDPSWVTRISVKPFR
jgi:ABC-type amino acid transport substrate-binding protein